MKSKSMLLLAVAVGCGLVAMLGVQQILKGNRKTAEADMVKVYVAAQDILAGVELDETMLKTESWPKASAPKGVITDIKRLENRALVVKAFPGDLILEAKLGKPGVTGPSVAIPQGMRVVTVPVNLTQAHSGLIQPEDRVDVLVTYKTSDKNRNTTQRTKTVLEYIQVFATDKLRDADSAASAESAKTAMKNISLLVTPEQASLLMLAESKGPLHLALRHKGDKELGNGDAISDEQFDVQAVSAGHTVDEELNEGPIPQNAEQPGDVKQFLDNNADPNAAKVAAAPTTKTWTITIFEKDAMRQEQITLPLEPGEKAEAELEEFAEEPLTPATPVSTVPPKSV